MLRAFHLLLAIAVLWCGLHVTSPAEARETACVEHVVENGPADDHGTGPEGVRHACHHHHCPVAPALRATSAEQVLAVPTLMPVGRAILAMASLSQAPPLEPPTV